MSFKHPLCSPSIRGIHILLSPTPQFKRFDKRDSHDQTLFTPRHTEKRQIMKDTGALKTEVELLQSTCLSFIQTKFSSL